MTDAVARARAALDGGRPELAIRALEPAIGQDAEDANVWCLLALAHLRLDDDASALAAANRAASVAPDEEWPHRLASIALARMGQPQEAVRAAYAAVERGPDLWSTHVQFASALRMSGQLPMASRAAREAVSLGPMQTEAHTELGRVLLDQRASAEAQKSFERAMELDPTNAHVRNELARAQLARRDVTSALTGFGSAAGLAPGLATPRLNFEVVLRNLVAQAAYLTFFLAFLATTFAPGTDDPGALRGAHIANGVSAAIIVAFLAWAVGRRISSLSPQLRKAALQVARRDRLLGLGVLAVCACPVLFLVSVVCPGGALADLTLGALGVAILARVLVVISVRRAKRLRATQRPE